MTENDMEKGKVTFEDLLESAKREDWDFVDANINESHVIKERIDWAIFDGIFDEDENVRDFAATLLNKTDVVFDKTALEVLEKRMNNDDYHIVRYRIAIVLYGRNYITPEIQKMIGEAREDPDVGELAKACMYKISKEKDERLQS